MGIITVLTSLLSQNPSLTHKHRIVNIGGTFELTGVASQAGEELVIVNQLLFKSKKGIFYYCPGGISRVKSGNRTNT
jgi:hypothetical protein